jgi:hypothetical protein
MNNTTHRYWRIGDDPNQKLTTYKQCYQEAKKRKKITLFKNIVCILRNEIKMQPNNKYGNAQELMEYLLNNSVICNTSYGFQYWLDSWEIYIKAGEDGMNRLQCARKGIKPNNLVP